MLSKQSSMEESKQSIEEVSESSPAVIEKKESQSKEESKAKEVAEVAKKLEEGLKLD